MRILSQLGDMIWNPWLLGLFLFVGLYYSVRTGFFQLFSWRLWLKTTLGALIRPGGKRRGKGGITQFQAMATALAATIGTGSIAGVATAIFWGGPGAVFWMWVSALLGMMTGCAEKILAICYRRMGKNGWEGGPMDYISQGLGAPALAALFALGCLAASLGGGTMVQSNSISTALKAAFGWNPLVVGAAVALLSGVVVLGGIGRIGRVSECLVPAMALLFIGGGVIVLACHARAILPALERIVTSALIPQAGLGGAAGYGVMSAMRYGVARGVFTNEAGLGTSAMAHAAADVEEPAEQGMWGIFEVFLATLVICTVTALVILTTGVYSEEAALAAIQSGTIPEEMLGAPLSVAAFSTVFGPFGGIFVAVCLLLFAFTSLLGLSYYGERSLAYLAGSERFTKLYRLVFLFSILVGSTAELSMVWQLADLCNGLMALPNLIALLLLSPEALRLLRRWAGEKTPTNTQKTPRTRR